MTDRTADRIRLAEWMGWRQSAVGNWYKNDDFLVEDMQETFELPDPFNDANDTEAVMHHLKERGYMVSIDFWAGEVSIAHENATPGNST
jgi:hypothetical protein